MTIEKHTEPNPETDFVCVGERVIIGPWYRQAEVIFKAIPSEAGFGDDDYIIFEEGETIIDSKKLNTITKKVIWLSRPLPTEAITHRFYRVLHNPRNFWHGYKSQFRVRIAKKIDDEYITQEDTITESVTFYWPSPVFKRICLYCKL